MNETYVLTPKGLVGEAVWNEIVRYAKMLGCNGIVINGLGGQFVKIESQPKEKKK